MKKYFLAVIVFLMPAMMAFAVKVTSLYEVKLPVMSQQEDDRTAAAHDGLLQVLMKLSGDPEIAKNSVIKAALKRSDYYIQEYSYEQPHSTEASYTLRLKFDKTDIRKLLKRSGIQFWGEKRPLILVWMVTSELNGDYQVIGSEEPNRMLDAFHKESKKYGLPVIFPMMDMTDIGMVSSEDIASMNISALDSAGRRYAPDALLIGVVADNKQLLSSRWLLVRNGKVWEWTLSESSPDQLFSTLLNQVRQTLSKQVALNAEEIAPSSLKVKVKNVQKQEDLQALMSFLNQVVPAMKVQLSQVSGGVVDMDVSVSGGFASLQDNEALWQHLSLVSRDEENNQLVYEWKS